ncbi:pentatricopeptide repeat-containing protein At2g13600-like [Nicotiana tabacum]|uniref:Pentatricopeptide repeat-containing protein At2g13600-like n=1 Tax=Nicotiana tabacum TaxID=4097 RepID=A0A1S3YTQ4_TOBAC|nr:PREDICTED: pentatricopeptide repeat-containing protein At2g13600-like [Nicotiana tabacum]
MLISKLRKLTTLHETRISIHNNEPSFSTFTSKKNYRSLVTMSFTWDKNQEEEESKYSNILRQCVKTSKLDNAKAIHAKLLKNSGSVSSLYLHNHLLNAYMKCGDTVNGLKLFDEMPQKNVVSWTALIAGFVQKGYPIEAFSLFTRMHQSGTKPNEFTFVSALHACSFEDRLNLTHAYQVYGLITRLGFESNVYLVNAFLTALIRHGRLGEALKVFDWCLNKDIVTWNAMLGGCMQSCCSEVPRLWYRMIREGLVPDNFSFASVLTGLAELLDLDLGIQVHGQLVKSGHGSEMCVGNSLVDMYLKNRSLAEGFKAFEEIPLKDVCSWTQMAAGCLNCDEPIEALRVIGEMRRAGVMPNKFTLATAFSSCANTVSFQEGEKVHGLRIKLGDDIDVCVDNAMLDMYVKCGCMDGAFMAFRSMGEHTTVSWTTMIMGYAQNGYPKKALETFNQMREDGADPNYITFICVIYACSQGGLIDEGWKYFTSMSHDYGILPGEDHYACMVNLLGRAGRIREAEKLILSMPFQPGLLVWQTLLGASRLHGDMEAAKRAAERALQVDRVDPSIYVLLSNTFAGLQNWDGVGTLRELMQSRDVKKVPGSSWL